MHALPSKRSSKRRCDQVYNANASISDSRYDNPTYSGFESFEASEFKNCSEIKEKCFVLGNQTPTAAWKCMNTGDHLSKCITSSLNASPCGTFVSVIKPSPHQQFCSNNFHRKFFSSEGSRQTQSVIMRLHVMGSLITQLILNNWKQHNMTKGLNFFCCDYVVHESCGLATLWWNLHCAVSPSEICRENMTRR